MATHSQFLALPQELMDQILDEIDDFCTSVCLGLTCKRMYAYHRAEYASICSSLKIKESPARHRDCDKSRNLERDIHAHGSYKIGPETGKGIFLYQLIGEFMRKGGYEYAFRRNGKIVMRFVRVGVENNEEQRAEDLRKMAEWSGGKRGPQVKQERASSWNIRTYLARFLHGK